uniref:Uncharacterized protein n=1 Tax=Plectus sambesii TaxID=2011161 RepID=A0A914X9I7_9BILA
MVLNFGDAVDLLNRKQLSPYQEQELQRYINNHLHVICMCSDHHGKDSGKDHKSPSSHSDLLNRLRSNGDNPYGSPRKGVSWFDDLRSRSMSPRRTNNDDDSKKYNDDHNKKYNDNDSNKYNDDHNKKYNDDDNKKYKNVGEGDGLECTTLKWGGRQRVIRPDDPVPQLPRETRASSLPLAKRNKKFYYSPQGDGVDSAALGDPNDVAWRRNGGGNSNGYNDGHGYGSDSGSYDPQNGYGRASPNLRVGTGPYDTQNGYGRASPNLRVGSGSGDHYGDGRSSPNLRVGGRAGDRYGEGSGARSPSGYSNGYSGGNSPRGGNQNGYGGSGMGQRNGYGGSQPSLYSDDDSEVPLSYRHGYDYDRARNAYITNPRALIHEFATKTPARETSRSPLPSPRPNSQAEDYNFAPYPPYRAVGAGHDPKKFVRKVRDDGLTHRQKVANQNLEPVHKSPLPQSVHQLKAIAAKKGNAIPGTKEIDFLTGCMLHNLYTGKGAAQEIWE